MATKTISVHGKRVAVDIIGEGRPLLLVHGFPMDARMWSKQLEPLGAAAKVIAPDLPGFGESELPNSVMTPANYADFLADLLESLEINEAVTVCGLSMGGYIALEFWKRHPSLVNSLIFCHTKATSDTPEAIENRKKTADNARRKGAEDLARDMPVKLTSPDTQQNNIEVMEQLSSMIADQPGPSIAAASLGMAQRANFVSFLPDIAVPALIIAGDKDTLIPMTEMEMMAKVIPHAKFVVIKNSGHLSPMEKPNEFNQDVLAFLAR
jgi:3-oxoadipate enol-lactonase